MRADSVEGVIVRLTYSARGSYVGTGRRKEKEKTPCKKNHTFYNIEGRKGSPTMGSFFTWEVRTKQTLLALSVQLN